MRVLGAVAVMAFVLSACGGDDAPVRMCDHVASADDIGACQQAVLDGEARCDSSGGDLLDSATCQERVYRDAATCLYCAPCLEYTPQYECAADCDAAFAACLKRGNNVVGCQEDQVMCFSACGRAHACPAP